MDSVAENLGRMLRSLRAIDPELRKQLVRRIKEIGKPVESAIKSAIPEIAPLSGMVNKGRLGWGVGKPAKSTTLSLKSSGSKVSSVTPLLRVIVNSPATVMADMAGRRAEGNTPAGRQMIRQLNIRKRRASRFVYPAGDAAKPGVEEQIKATIEVAQREIERKF
jgi:hypothetical protein